MNQLTTIEKNAFDKLPLNLREFTVARVEKPIKEYTDNELKKQLYDIIAISYTEQAQFNIEPSMLAFQRDALFNEIKSSTKFKELTLSEVKKAFTIGIRGESGPFFGMCAKTYHQFLKYYHEKPERVEGMKLYLELMNAETKTELTPSEKRAKSFDAVEYFFKEYKETGKILTGHYQIYQFLMDEGKIKWTKEEKNAISGPIKEAYKKEIEQSYKRGKVRKTDYELILSSLESNPTLIGRVRKEALTRYFNKLINEGKELISLIG